MLNPDGSQSQTDVPEYPNEKSARTRLGLFAILTLFVGVSAILDTERQRETELALGWSPLVQNLITLFLVMFVLGKVIGSWMEPFKTPWFSMIAAAIALSFAGDQDILPGATKAILGLFCFCIILDWVLAARLRSIKPSSGGPVHICTRTSSSNSDNTDSGVR